MGLGRNTTLQVRARKMIIVLQLACVTPANQDLGNEQTLADFEIRELKAREVFEPQMAT